MKKASLILTTILIFGLFIVGCQNAGQVVDSQDSLFCTACKSETKTTFIKGLNNTTFKCPKCETEVEYDDHGENTVLHTCTKCGRALEKCPLCRKQQ